MEATPHPNRAKSRRRESTLSRSPRLASSNLLDGLPPHSATPYPPRASLRAPPNRHASTPHSCCRC
eukprot:6823518-Prymnesium_polylepis.1